MGKRGVLVGSQRRTLTREQVIEIRAGGSYKRRLVALARKFDVSYNVVRSAYYGITYANIVQKHPSGDRVWVTPKRATRLFVVPPELRFK